MIKAVFKYSSFTIAFILVSVTFITAVNFTQLAVAIVIYSLFALFTYKAFPNFWSSYSKKPEVLFLPNKQDKPDEKTEAIEVEKTQIIDMDKRAFLKLIGATGLSFFLISVFGRKVESLLFGQNIAQGQRGDPNAGKTSSTPALPTEEYSISGIDYDADGYFGYVKGDGGWYIMKRDSNNRSFLYVKGESKFPQNWDNRENLRYDYFNNVFKS